MAQELTLNANIRFQPASGVDSGVITQGNNLKITITGTVMSHHLQSVGFSAREAIVLGEVTSPGWLMCKNRDLTNLVHLFTDVSTGTGIATLNPGEFCIIPLHTAAAAPAVQAAVAACIVEFFLILR